jgi:SAM-dependent methyltransferase
VQLSEPLWKSKLRRGSRFLVERGPGEVWRQARERGPRECAIFLGRQLRYSVGEIVGRRFDRRHAVDTGGVVPRDEMEIVGEEGKPNLGADFVSTPERIFQRALNRIPEKDFSRFTFIDFGCGKGRALLLAATRNFRRVLGVEHAPMLAEIAARNIRAWRGARLCHDVQVVCADATQFELPNDPCVLFFYGPFGGNMSLLGLVLANAAASVKEHPRHMYLLFLDGVDQRLPDREVLAEGFRRLSAPGGERCFDLGATRIPLYYALYESQ